VLMERIPLYQVDAFTTVAFRGNPAAVCLLPGPVADSVLQAIAAEMNLSETAFLLRTNHRRSHSGDTFSLRWFTPQTEVPLCGHATLATAAVLFDIIGVTATEVTFQTLSGDLSARKCEDGIALDFPADPPVPCKLPAQLLGPLGLSEDMVVASCYGATTHKLLLHLADRKLVTDLSPDFQALLAAETKAAYRGLIVTAAGANNGDYDFLSRFFAPWLGINEDPVTGSAHTVLAPYWAEQLGKSEFRAFQASARGGELGVRLLGGGRVELLGHAVLVFEGYLTLPESAALS
jgi:PhzF family phenazine biosynthesis protein